MGPDGPAAAVLVDFGPMQTPNVFLPPQRLLMGPGPSMVAPTVYEALARPTLGHLDPEFIRMMEEVKEMLDRKSTRLNSSH